MHAHAHMYIYSHYTEYDRNTSQILNCHLCLTSELNQVTMVAPNPLHKQNATQGKFFNRSSVDLNSVFFFLKVVDILLYSHEQVYIHICVQKHIQHNKDVQTQFFRKLYLSFYWKGCVWEGIGDRTKTATYWPPNSSGYHSLSFPFSWIAHPGAWGPSLCWDMVLIPASSLQLIWTSCRRGYIIIWHPPTVCERHIYTQFNPSTAKVIPLSPDIFDCMYLLFTLVYFFFWQLGRGQKCNNTKFRENCLTYYLLKTVRGMNSCFHTFPKSFSAIRSRNSHVNWIHRVYILR